MGNGGRTIACAIGSSEPKELKALRAVLRYCLQLTKKAAAKQKTKRLGMKAPPGMMGGGAMGTAGMGQDEDTMTNLYDGDSLISGVKSAGHSLISGVSKTVYGKQTMDKKALRRMRQEGLRSGGQ